MAGLRQFAAAKTNPDYDNSIGVFFGRVIKSRPDLYPYVKVEAQAADSKHRQKIMDEAAESLMGRLSRPDAMWVVSMIADGEVTHITINY